MRRNVRRRRAALAAFFAVMGPGIITGFAGNDAGGVATYTAAGARFGFSLLWLLLIASLSLVVVQEMCARMGAVTGKGLSDLIRERFGVRWTILAMLALFISNASNVVAEYAGIAASMGLVGVPPWVSVPVAGLVVWALIVFASYKLVERALFALILAFVAYPISIAILRPDWSAVARGFVPTQPADPAVLAMALALVGTTVTPYMLFYLQASVVDKGIDRESFGLARLDAVMGATLSGLFAFFIVVVAGAVLFPAGLPADTAEQAAQALRPLAGDAAGFLFGVGLLAASLLGLTVMPLSTSYAICEAFGWESGISKDFGDAPVFMGLVTFLIAAGGAIVLLVPQQQLLPLIIVSQAVNGLLLPIVLVFIMRLASDPSVMGADANGRVRGILGWGVAGLTGSLSVAYLVARALGIG
ncbi:MAG: Nramp family divalent metal transporter [Chloroflexota bacterium]|nr:Nramp family divalent metal transporter [Chloroflexota bacterium]